MNIYDTAVIGSGPAGISAALNLQLHNKEILWFGTKNFSTKVAKSEKIANYPGAGYISGPELIARFDAHVKEAGLEITEQMVTAVLPNNGTFMLSAGSDVYQAKTLLLAAGAAQAKGFAGEEEFLGRGVSYCATCDGFLYKGKTIAVWCGDPRFEHEVKYLAELAGKVYVYAPYKGFSLQSENLELLPKPVKAVSGGMKVNALTLTDDTEIAVDGVFALRNAIAPATLLGGLELDGPHIVVDREMKTNIPGVFAAGDCTGRPYQIAKAVGEGNIAAHSIISYLN